eukprot:CAMPEP_0204525094 /NCGR_PEP_ID=MMETSP0661-20131031/7720_1 /ASSEMBLY_ACC=CAM_ASM_000606 /TAXON_ID=109239 /ORGANISM="Alexandrium margalefi, Strain AMGDE01CS-322" /LENGTH=136 /DNA_ID=CAMNT_0051530879 /DNA_START=110 /DNA_END=520 /DNA_ORIENTATION=+
MGGGDGDALDNSKITVWDSCCCCYDGILMTENCLGCMESATCLCCEYECCCKKGVDPLCCGCCAIRCVEVTVCIKGQAQCCCLVEAASIPCDKEVPMMVGCCFVTCYPGFNICKTLGEINGTGGDSGAGGQQIGGS